MSELVYALCALTSIACAVLLTRSWLRTRAKLLFWSSLCFAGFTVNNVLLFVDEVVYPEAIDLTLPRAASAFVAVLALVIGLVWSSNQP